MAEPAVPGAERREWLLNVIGEYVARGGAATLLATPVEPGEGAFPDPWDASKRGVSLLLQRLAWHAGQAWSVSVSDEQMGARPTQRKPETHVELVSVRERAATSGVRATRGAGGTGETGETGGTREHEYEHKRERGTLELTSWFVGEDDVAGTLAHELGVAHAVLARVEAGDPYRVAEAPVHEVDQDRDLERGSVATVYLGLGVLAANAAYQQYSSAGRFNGAYSPLEYDVLRAGYVPMSELAYLLAVQAVVRGEAAAPVGLSPPQRDEVGAWIDALRGQSAALRERLGVAADATGTPRTAPKPFELDDEEEERRDKIAFRWKTNRTGEGFLTGVIAGIGLGVLTAAFVVPNLGLGMMIAGPVLGLWIGQATRIVRCSTCATVIARDATACRKCRSTMHGDIERRADRLEAEERVLESGADRAHDAGSGSR